MILGIHGLKTDIEKFNFWPNLKYIYGNKIDIPQLPNNDFTEYKDWQKEFDKIDFSNYDTIIAHSMGCRMLIEYLKDENINKINKILLLSPAFSVLTGKKENNIIIKRPELKYTYNTLKEPYLQKETIEYFSKISKEILLFHSKKDYRISHLGIRHFIKHSSNEKIKTIHNNDFKHFLKSEDYKYFKNFL